jgi:hypothetical protein
MSTANVSEKPCISVEAGSQARLKLAFFIEVPNPEFTLSSDVLRRISDLGLDLELDIYAF